MFTTICYLIKCTLWGGGATVKDLVPQCGGEELRSPHLQPKLLGYFDDLIKKPRFQS
jgi:hypothetical protein